MADCPTEEQEHMAFVQWCHARNFPIHHSANEAGGSSQAMKLRAMKAKRMGTAKGFPDLLVYLPIKGITGEIDAYQPLAIEMKRQKGSTTQPEQKKWGEILEMSGTPFKVCKGCEEAIKFVHEMEREIDNEI